MDQRTKGLAASLFFSAPIVAVVDFGRWYSVDTFAEKTVMAAQAYLDVAKSEKVSPTIVNGGLNAYAGLVAPMLREGTPRDFENLAKEAFKYCSAIEKAFPAEDPVVEAKTQKDSAPTGDGASSDLGAGDGTSNTGSDATATGSEAAGTDAFPTEKLELPDGVKEKLIQADMPTAQAVRAGDKTGKVLDIDGIGETVRKKILAAVDKAIGPEVQ